MSGTAYRPDIDGLRAVAVLLVVLSHLGFHFVKGGFVGVDIFFVISGYLISSIIVSEAQADKFSLARFYERRIRRIGPALLVMMIATSALAYLYLFPSEMKQFATSAIYATLSASNIFFWSKSSYFDTVSDFQPLLHTWSLAVEEQFYLFFPLLITAVYRWVPTKLRATIVALASVSFAISAAQVVLAPTSAFYLPFGRAWELLMGTMVYLRLFPALTTRVQRNLASSAGAAMISVAAFQYSPKMPFPGVAALLPCVGTALVIAAGIEGASLVGKVLSVKPVVGIGLISYSLYLWHWPILVFQRLNSFLLLRASVHRVQLAVLCVSLVIAYLSWRFVEKPFRAPRPTVSRSMLFRVASACALTVVVISMAALTAQGIPSRYPREAVRVAQYQDYNARNEYRLGTCFITSQNTLSNFEWLNCLREDTGKRNMLLMGDSHAAQLWWGLTNMFPNINFMQATASGCEPTLEQSRGSNPNCAQLMSSIYSDFLQNHHVEQVLVAGQWQAPDLPRIQSTLMWMKSKGIRVTLFGPMVRYDSSLPRLLARAIQLNDPHIPDEHRYVELERLDRDMEGMSRELKVPYISFFKMLCSDGHCLEYVQGIPLQSDSSHLTREGSILVADRLRQSKQSIIF